jgi:hypothetical protein
MKNKRLFLLPSPSSCKNRILVKGISHSEFPGDAKWGFCGRFDSVLSNVCRRYVFVKFVFVDDDDEGKWRGFCLLFFVVIDERNGDDVTVLTRCEDFLIGVDVEEQEDRWLLLFRWWQHQQKNNIKKHITARGIRMLRRTIRSDEDDCWIIERELEDGEETE